MKNRSPKDQDIMRAVSLFFAVRGVVRTKLAQGKRLDPSAWLRIETLKFIADRGKPNMRDLAAYLSITAPSATSLVRGLVRERLVMRATSRVDRRASELSLTPKGKALLAKALVKGTRLLGEVFSVLSPSELAAFARALERIRDGAGE
jgi:DNA-binding MarR family transcriptional regulator